jgi:glucokinase
MIGDSFRDPPYAEDGAASGSDARARRAHGRALLRSADAMRVIEILRGLNGVSTTDELIAATGVEKGDLERALRLVEHGALVRSKEHVRLADMADGTVLAVDVGGTNVRAALADRRGGILAKIAAPTNQDNIVGQVSDLHAKLCRDGGFDVRQTYAACVGIPASYEPGADRAWNCANLTALKERRPAQDFGRALGMPVAVAQDVRLAVVGERWRGWGRGEDDFVVVCLGTGVAMGIVACGELCVGGRGAAGEISLLPLGADPFDPLHQRRGPFEDFVSGPSFLARWLKAGGASAYLDRDAPTHAGEIFAAARRGDVVAIAEIRKECRVLALGIVAVVATLDPAVVVLGGGLGANSELFEPLRHNVQLLMPNAPPLQVSPLREDGPLVGAVAVAATLSFRPADNQPTERAPT